MTVRAKKGDAWKAGKPIFTQDGIRKVQLQAGRNVINRLRTEWKAHAASIPPYPGGFEGKGIVICAGGLRYFTCAWITLQLLKKYNCPLPIEVWYIGNEFTPEVIAALTDMGITCKNAADHTTARFDGVALKPLAILHSSFKEVLFIDADNISMSDPSYLFEAEEYNTLGAIFWPDIWKTDKSNPIWKITGTNDYDSMELESGQLLVNKAKCWKELNLCLHFNEQRQYYYSMLLGDKDTFRFAWQALRTPYHLIQKSVAFSGYFNEKENAFFGLSMVQHDTAGRILFIHRNLLKWDITDTDEMIWKEIRQFRDDGGERRINGKFIHTPNGIGFNILDVQGDLDVIDFKDACGSIESECLHILRDLRESPLYARYLLYSYFGYFKPQYHHNAGIELATTTAAGEMLYV
jgi:alpha 1,2-mannosyltransferase